METQGMGAFIRARREKLGMTQSALAAASGVSRAYLSQIETGKVGVTSPGVRRRIAAVIGARQIDLLVAAGELLPEEVADVTVPRPLPPDVARIVEILTDDDMPYKADVLEAILRMVDAWEGVSQAHRRAATG